MDDDEEIKKLFAESMTLLQNMCEMLNRLPPVVVHSDSRGKRSETFRLQEFVRDESAPEMSNILGQRAEITRIEYDAEMAYIMARRTQYISTSCVRHVHFVSRGVLDPFGMAVTCSPAVSERRFVHDVRETLNHEGGFQLVPRSSRYSNS